MAVTLNGVTLSRSIQWTNRYEANGAINQEYARSVNGTQIIFQKKYDLGRRITLSGEDDTGWFTKAMVDSILGFVENLNLVMVLDFNGEVHNVMFDWSVAEPATFSPIKSQETYTADDWFTGTLRLITVE